VLDLQLLAHGPRQGPVVGDLSDIARDLLPEGLLELRGGDRCVLHHIVEDGRAEDVGVRDAGLGDQAGDL